MDKNISGVELTIHWLPIDDRGRLVGYYCSNCHAYQTRPLPDFCPVCGHKMIDAKIIKEEEVIT